MTPKWQICTGKESGTLKRTQSHGRIWIVQGRHKLIASCLHCSDDDHTNGEDENRENQTNDLEYDTYCIKNSNSASLQKDQSTLPCHDDDVAEWAEDEFNQTLHNGHGRIQNIAALLKICMLVSVEEAGAHLLLRRSNVGEEDDRGHSSMSLADAQHMITSESTWSLERIQILADAVKNIFFQDCEAAGLDSAESFESLMKQYPTMLVSAINAVLFQSQGYRRMKKYGNPWNTNLSTVLDHGEGSPAALTILYLAVSHCLGFHLQTLPLEDGRYFVLWPTDEDIVLSAGGEQFVIDAYAEGSLLSEEEISIVFGVDMPFSPASLNDIATAYLTQLRDTHWCLALDCPPEPAFAVECCVEVALGDYEDVEVFLDDGGNGAESGMKNMWWPRHMYHVERALSMAQKILKLNPENETTLDATIKVALLSFFAGHYKPAICAIDQVLSQFSGGIDTPQHATLSTEEEDKLMIFRNKCSLLLSVSASNL